jgi:hypothetical protein
MDWWLAGARALQRAFGLAEAKALIERAPRGGLGDRRGVDGPSHLEFRTDRHDHRQRTGTRATNLLERCSRKSGGLRRWIGKLTLANGFWNRGKADIAKLGWQVAV